MASLLPLELLTIFLIILADHALFYAIQLGSLFCYRNFASRLSFRPDLAPHANSPLFRIEKCFQFKWMFESESNLHNDILTWHKDCFAWLLQNFNLKWREKVENQKKKIKKNPKLNASLSRMNKSYRLIILWPIRKFCLWIDGTEPCDCFVSLLATNVTSHF